MPAVSEAVRLLQIESWRRYFFNVQLLKERFALKTGTLMVKMI